MIFNGYKLPPNKKDKNHRDKIIVDEKIFEKIADNDMAAFEEFYQMTERSVYAYLLSIVKNHDIALDLVQDTYLKIGSAAHLYQPMGKPMAWVYTIAKNLAMTRLQSEKRTGNALPEDIENKMSISWIENMEDRHVLQMALKVLDEEEAEIILLHAVSDYTFLEISRSLGKPLSTVLSKNQRGLKKLRKYLSEKEVL